MRTPDPEETVVTLPSKVRKATQQRPSSLTKSFKSTATHMGAIDLQYYSLICGQRNLWDINESTTHQKSARLIINNSTDRWVRRITG